MSGGFNIHPDEINEVLLRYPDVSDAATVGLPDPDWGELVVSAVESDVMIEEGKLINHCRQFLEPMKVPKAIVVSSKLPRGISGKVMLSDVNNLIVKAIRASDKKNNNISESDIINLASTVFNVPSSDLYLHLSPDKIHGWDSLGHLNLISSAEEKYEIQFSVDDMMKINSLQSLLDFIQVRLKQQKSHGNDQSHQSAIADNIPPAFFKPERLQRIHNNGGYGIEIWIDSMKQILISELENSIIKEFGHEYKPVNWYNALIKRNPLGKIDEIIER